MKEFRRNNPMNLRYNVRNNWYGQKGQTNGFCCFEDVRHGFRAAFITLKNYGQGGHNTIRKIITRWAPPSENPTQTYIRFVSLRMAYLGYCDSGDWRDMADTRLDMKNPELLVDLMAYMTRFESGIQIQPKEIRKLLSPFGYFACDDEPLIVAHT